MHDTHDDIQAIYIQNMRTSHSIENPYYLWSAYVYWTFMYSLMRLRMYINI